MEVIDHESMTIEKSNPKQRSLAIVGDDFYRLLSIEPIQNARVGFQDDLLSVGESRKTASALFKTCGHDDRSRDNQLPIECGINPGRDGGRLLIDIWVLELLRAYLFATD
ncbi:MAG: hypothetical protein ACKOAH_11060, partial [Pirellula sp.]